MTDDAPAMTDDRAAKIAVATCYLDALVSHEGSDVPLAARCRRTERGRETGGTGDEIREQLGSHVMHGITGYDDVRWFVDGDQVIAFYVLHAYGARVDIAERFLVRDGEIHEIEAIFELPKLR